jgi:hypothetical protein
MRNDAEAQEVHATVTDSEEPGKPVNGYQDEPVSDDRSEPIDRPDDAGEDDELIDPDEVIVAKDSSDGDDLDDLDEAEDDTHPDTVAASAIVVEPVAADDSVADPPPAGDTMAEPVPPDDTMAEPVPADDTMAEPVPADDTMAEPVPADDIMAETFPADDAMAASGPASSSVGPKHAAADSGPVRSGMPMNGDLPKSSPMVGDPEQLHERWAAIQSTFVDDPRGSVTSAANMVTEVIAAVVTSAQERESGLRGDWDRDGVDTEGLRNALRSYRALLDQLAAL